MTRRLPLWALALLLVAGSSTACRRELRKRERELVEAQARAKERALVEQRARALALQNPEPMPLEPPLEKTLVAGSGLPCNVDDVFARKCRRCHNAPARHAAPFVLFTWDDTRKERSGHPLYTIIGRSVASGYMPYNIQANPPVERLTDSEKKIILDWVAAGAPKEDCDPNPPLKGKAKSAPHRPGTEP